MSKDAVKAHFSSLAEEGIWASLYEPGAKVSGENFSYLIRARRVMELLQSTGKPLKEFLDVGCGTAPLGPAILGMGSSYTGIDFSAEMITAACRVLGEPISRGKARLMVGDAANLGLPEAAFDTVVAMGLVEYFSRSRADQVIEEIARVLSPGGVAIVTIPKRWNWTTVVNRLATPLRNGIRWRPRRVQLNPHRKEAFKRLHLTPDELDRAARKAGLRKIGHRHYNVEIAGGPFITLAPRLAYFINHPFEWLALIPGGSVLATGYIGMYTHD
jgi:SAM-dependent methyltransferase